MSTSKKLYGSVKFFAEGKGYGFIVPADGGADVFFHIKNVNDGKAAPPQKEDKVSYTIVTGKRGPEAGDVSIIA